MASTIPTVQQVSAGGVIVRKVGGSKANRPGRVYVYPSLQVALICVGPKKRWQLPKGLVEPGETPEAAAIRETCEEAGVLGEIVTPLPTVEYWYVGTQGHGAKATKVRYHKFVHFFLMEYVSGDVKDHDREVLSAHWAPIKEAISALAFASERRVVEQALAYLLERRRAEDALHEEKPRR